MYWWEILGASKVQHLSPGVFSEEYPEVYLTYNGKFTIYEEDRLVLAGRLMGYEGNYAIIQLYGAEKPMIILKKDMVS